LWFTYNFNKNIIELIPHQIKAHDRDLECYIIDIKDIHIDTPPPPRICNMSTSDSCNEGASISNDDVCDVNDKLQNMSTVDKDNDTSVCANCGMEGASNMCAKCKQVKYCNAVCKKVHKRSTRKIVRNILDLLLSMRPSYSKNHPWQKIVQSASLLYLLFIRGTNTRHAVES